MNTCVRYPLTPTASRLICEYLRTASPHPYRLCLVYRLLRRGMHSPISPPPRVLTPSYLLTASPHPYRLNLIHKLLACSRQPLIHTASTLLMAACSRNPLVHTASPSFMNACSRNPLDHTASASSICSLPAHDIPSPPPHVLTLACSRHPPPPNLLTPGHGIPS